MGVYPEAIVTRNGQTIILLVVNDVVSEIPVEIGSSLHGLIPVQGEVVEGDTVVMSPPDDLFAGSPIQERSRESGVDRSDQNPRNRR